MIDRSEIVKKLYQYLYADRNFQSFHGWLLQSHTMNKDAEATYLLSEIENHHTNFSNGLITDLVWIRQLQNIFQQNFFTRNNMTREVAR